MNWRDKILSDPQVLRGKPCIKGTRIPVALVLGHLAAGRETRAIPNEFPDLTEADIVACLDFARELADFEAVIAKAQELGAIPLPEWRFCRHRELSAGSLPRCCGRAVAQPSRDDSAAHGAVAAVPEGPPAAGVLSRQVADCGSPSGPNQAVNLHQERAREPPRTDASLLPPSEPSSRRLRAVAACSGRCELFRGHAHHTPPPRHWRSCLSPIPSSRARGPRRPPGCGYGRRSRRRCD